MKYAIAVIGIASLHLGCTQETGPSTAAGWTGGESAIVNGLNFNSIAFNLAVFGTLSSRPLSLGRDSSGSLIFNSAGGLEATSEGRELLHYVAQCALPPDVRLLASHDGVTYQFPGLFALAPEWESQEITVAKKEFISACLLAHVNAFGAMVHISVRSPGVITADPAEIWEYPVYEGTFLGDLFGSEPHVYACTGDVPEIAAAHSADRLLRVCADAGSSCQLTVIGRCRDVCESYVDKYGWHDCQVGDRRYSNTVSVFLRDEDADGLNRSCPVGGDCRFSARSGDAIYDCADAGDCTIGCLSDSYCTVDGGGAGDLAAVTWWDSMSEVGCQLAGRCSTMCGGRSECEIDCWYADTCENNYCADGASCLLDCTGAGRCGFAHCSGGETSCPGDILVCNRSCP